MSISSNREEQLQEIEALASVYGENSGRISYNDNETPIKGWISIEFEPFLTPSELYYEENEVRKKRKVQILPPATLNFVLPDSYPSDSVPELEIECIWMSDQLLTFLHKALNEQCSSMAGMPVLYFCCQMIVDDIREREQALREICLNSTPYLRNKNLTSFEILKLVEESSEKSADHNFEANCYDCEVCFDNKTGKGCLKMSPCGHIFCLECVGEYIKEKTRGTQIQAITCMMGECFSLIPDQIIRNCIGEEEYNRYERILLDSALCQMSDVVICPRPTCQRNVILSEQNPKLGCCECGYSFCTYCKKAYHGIAQCNFNIYKTQKLIEKWTDANHEQRLEMAKMHGGMEKLTKLVQYIQSENWIGENSKKCPKCQTAIEKNNGCNKMICTKCTTPFCWLCEKALPQDNPYLHFREAGECSNRLFDGMDIDDLDGLVDDDELVPQWHDEDADNDDIMVNAIFDYGANSDDEG